MPVPTTHPRTPELLDALAHIVATSLDSGDEQRAWALTRGLEEIAGVAGDSDQPPSPVIGRRFARAHRRLLAMAPPRAARRGAGEDRRGDQTQRGRDRFPARRS